MNAYIFIENLKLFGVEIIDFKGIAELLLRFSFNLLVVWVIVRTLYYPITKRKDYLFSYLVLSVIIFLICYLLSNVKLQMGFALGLFAIFSIIRYRTNSIPIKEMTYLFVIIGISVINALANKKISYSELFFTNLVIIGIIYGLEKVWLLRHESRKVIIYEKIELIKPEKYDELINDLQLRTGLKINRIEIGKIDFLRDTTNIRIYYYSDQNIVNFTDENENNNETDDDD